MANVTMTASEIRTAATELNVDLSGLDLRRKADKATAIAMIADAQATVAEAIATLEVIEAYEAMNATVLGDAPACELTSAIDQNPLWEGRACEIATQAPDVRDFCELVDSITYTEATEGGLSAAVAEVVSESEGTFGSVLIAAIAWVVVFVVRTVRPQLNAMIRYARKVVLSAVPVERYNGRWQVRVH